MTTSKLFYTVAGACLLAFFFYQLMRLVLPDDSITIVSTARIRTTLAILLLLKATAQASQWLRTTVYLLFLPSLIGLWLVVMHWPFGYLLHFGSLGIIFVLLAAAASRSKRRIDRLLLLFYPFCRLLNMAGAASSAVEVLWYLEWAAAGLTGAYLLYRQFREKPASASDILDAPPEKD